ncbi:fungal-specific transcription factor domain-containing protein [Ilyonectria robusta]|uniref:fungal-specific transcription factor domain-containing protein n=1 Tax=Ilyonectria robusta TaxID=1079257 RepID=UPI001E8E2A1A|nr:fungal-specific transcription factor domain-containing protein [Ilyonectria robusta]KAH8659015.1 fungal-specific transcription factor domain-containing protein [Ilyonectria robusta]
MAYQLRSVVHRTEWWYQLGRRPANRQPEPRSLGTTAEKYIRGRVAIAWSIIKHQLTSTSTTPAGRWESFGDIRTWTSNKALNVREFGSRGGIPLKTRPPDSRGRLNDLPSLYPSTDGMLKLRAHSRNRGPCKACQASKRKCDQAKPQCSRCRKKNLDCEPSLQARWRVQTLHNSYDRETSSQTTPKTIGRVSETRLVQEGPQQADLIDHTSASAFNQDAGNVECTAHIEDALASFNPLEFPFSDLDTSGSQPMDSFSWTNLGSEGLSPLLLSVPSFSQSSFGVFSHEFLNTPPRLQVRDSPWRSTDSTLPNGTAVEITNTTQGLSDSTRLISDALSATIEDILNPGGLTEPSLSEHRSYFISLWQSFVEQIAPFLTPFGSRTDNPFLKYLVPQAEKSSELLIAVLRLAQIIVRRGRKGPTGPDGCFLEGRANDIQQVMEHANALAPNILGGEPEGRTSQTLLTLSTLLVLCMGFVATQDAAKLVYHLEYAAIICQDLFKTLAEDERFLYLAKLLGFIQNTLLFSTHSNSITTPDYLSVALEFHDQTQSNAFRELNGNLPDCVHFRDLDMFSGMSTSMASIVYTLGRLVKTKNAGLHGTYISHVECIRSFESDVDGLEARLRRHMALMTKHREQHPASTYDVSVMRFLDLFNEAVLWSAWTIFLTDLKNRSSASDADTHDAVEHILDACAEVPEESVTAQLFLFPLMIGGIRATKKVYREFVLNRMAKLDNIGLTDTKTLCEELKYWWSAERSMGGPTELSKFVF